MGSKQSNLTSGCAIDMKAFTRELRKVIGPNDHDKWGSTPLHKACQVGDVDRIRLLLHLDADPNLVTLDSHGSVSPLIFAAENGHANCLSVLLDHGADVNATDSWDNTAILKAACYNHIACVKILLEHAADPNISNRWGAMALQYACLQGNMEVVNLLCDSRRLEIDARGEKSFPRALGGAAMRGYEKCVRVLLENGADVNSYDTKRDSIVDNRQQKYTHRLCRYEDSIELDTALEHCLRYFLMACNGVESNTSDATLHDRFLCCYHLIKHGAVITTNCLNMLSDEAMLPCLCPEEYVLLVRLLLRALPYDRTSTDHHQAMYALFEHATRFGKYKSEIMHLIISVGYSPSMEQLRGLCYTLTDSQYSALKETRKQPLSLIDCCKLTVRGVVKSNVTHSVEHLEVPTLLKRMLSCDLDVEEII